MKAEEFIIEKYKGIIDFELKVEKELTPLDFYACAELMEEYANQKSVSEEDINIQAQIQSVGNYLDGSEYQKHYEQGFKDCFKWMRNKLNSKE